LFLIHSVHLFYHRVGESCFFSNLSYKALFDMWIEILYNVHMTKFTIKQFLKKKKREKLCHQNFLRSNWAWWILHKISFIYFRNWSQVLTDLLTKVISAVTSELFKIILIRQTLPWRKVKNFFPFSKLWPFPLLR